ncbi:MAG: hypothetical protein GW760_07370 [Legionella sp.]|jgi:hypothetical protein|nr:hypothetical protein [Legionella sp.]
MNKEVDTEGYDDEDELDLELDELDMFFQEREVEKQTLNLDARRRIEDLMDEKRMEAEAQDYYY